MSEEQTTMSAEQAADFAALQAQADTQAAPVAPGEVQAQPVDEIAPPSAASVQLASMIIVMAKPLICYAVPALKAAPEELWAPVPEGVAAVLDHYGLGESDFMRNPWGRMAFSLAPLAAFAALESMKEKPKDKTPADTMKPASIEAPKQDAQEAGQKTVTFGAEVPA